MTSQPLSISKPEIVKVSKNALVFLAPLASLYLAYVTQNIQTAGFSWSDFTPNQMIIGALVLYLLNAVMDFMRKFVPDTASSSFQPSETDSPTV